jgi:hypothetical protein
LVFNIVVEKVERPHILHPASLEFIRWLSTLPDVMFSFFSDAVAERNEAFSQELLKRAFDENFKTQKTNFHGVYSRHHEIIYNHNKAFHDAQSKIHHAQYGLHHGNHKKDLNVVAKKSGVPLAQTVLIDDDLSYVYYGQAKNFLKIHSSSKDNFTEYFQGRCEQALNANHIFFLVGLIKKLLNNRMTLLDNLFSLQFESTKDGNFNLKYYDDSLQEDPQYYLDGLQELQKINPELDFFGGEATHAFLKRRQMKRSQPEPQRLFTQSQTASTPLQSVQANAVGSSIVSPTP